jgi:hypothetical protein
MRFSLLRVQLDKEPDFLSAFLRRTIVHALLVSASGAVLL